MKNINTRRLMADAKFYESYARYRDDLGRYETWDEAVSRVMSMHRTRYASIMTPKLESLLQIAETAYKNKEILGAQRALQFGGEQLLKRNAKLYNCTASYLDRPSFFGECFWLMLCGCGVGFSVQKQHIAKLPPIAKRTKQAKTFIVEDSIEGWARAVQALMDSFFTTPSEYQGRKLYFDLTKIRPKGAKISGGFKAPGPEPLRKALDKIEKLIKDHLDTGATKLSTIVAYDCVMHIADAVISGGVRRAATICLFSHDDTDMITAKTGDWWHTNSQRGRKHYCVPTK
jgi:ribonucleoside-diphosphate reductase alpha chain